MAGRPRKFDLEAAYNAATDLFWAQGYEATSLDQLLITMHLSKSSFYQTFTSKKNLFEQCLSRYDEQSVTDMKNGLAGAPSAIDFIRTAFSQLSADAQNPSGRRGCLIMNTVVEFAQSDIEVARIFQRNLKATKKIFTGAVSLAQSSGDISETLDPPIVADFLVTTIIGLKTQAKAGISGKTIASIADLAVSSLIKSA
ncbi:TetR/AcrR family transcriptional regulator [OM182 bacterium]|nr:TetR/AcrR family transcriptional regulator [OM182 bacterium]